jgi:FkbM family methyltransferase
MVKKIFVYLEIQVLFIRNLIANGSTKNTLQKKILVKLNSEIFESKIPNYLLPIIFKFFRGYIPNISMSEKLAIELFREASKSHKFASNSKIFRKFIINSQNADERFWDFAAFCLDKQALSFSKDLQDLWVLFESSDWNDLSYLEIGAGDGEWKSNCKLLQDFGWKGISIEPNPLLAKKFKKNRTNTILNVALVPNDSLVMFEADPKITLFYEPGRETQGSLMLSDFKNKNFISTRVEATSIAKLRSHEMIYNNFTYISIDMEGGESQILADLFHEGIRPKLITVEHNNIPQVKNSITKLMEINKYQEKFPGIGRNESFYKLDA